MAVSTWTVHINPKQLGIDSKRMFLYLVQLYQEYQQQIVTSFICDNKGLVEYILKYFNNDMTYIAPDVTEADIILPKIHCS